MSENVAGDRAENRKKLDSVQFKENELYFAFDRCCTDAIIKTVGGTFVGTLASMLLLRRRTWPVYLGAGFGLGLAYRGCERYLDSINEDETNFAEAVPLNN